MYVYTYYVNSITLPIINPLHVHVSPMARMITSWVKHRLYSFWTIPITLPSCLCHQNVICRCHRTMVQVVYSLVIEPATSVTTAPATEDSILTVVCWWAHVACRLGRQPPLFYSVRLDWWLHYTTWHGKTIPGAAQASEPDSGNRRETATGPHPAPASAASRWHHHLL